MQKSDYTNSTVFIPPHIVKMEDETIRIADETIKEFRNSK
jgi:hypothetical protein